VFNEIMGVPTHPLLVHAAVVFVPLLCLLSVVYALVPAPRVRGAVGWAAGLLSIGAPLAAWFATLSGTELEKRLVAQNFGQEILNQVKVHRDFGNRTWWFSMGLGGVTLLLILVSSARSRRSRGLPALVSVIFALAILALAGITAYYVFKTGDTGAKAVWGTTG
jgi:uncharacterized membrane protein